MTYPQDHFFKPIQCKVQTGCLLPANCLSIDQRVWLQSQCRMGILIRGLKQPWATLAEPPGVNIVIKHLKTTDISERAT